MSSSDLSEAEWRLLEPLLPPERGRKSRPAFDNQQAGIREAGATTLAQAMADNSRHSPDSTTVRGHVSAAGAKGESRTSFWPFAVRVHL